MIFRICVWKLSSFNVCFFSIGSQGLNTKNRKSKYITFFQENSMPLKITLMHFYSISNRIHGKPHRSSRNRITKRFQLFRLEFPFDSKTLYMAMRKSERPDKENQTLHGHQNKMLRFIKAHLVEFHSQTIRLLCFSQFHTVIDSWTLKTVENSPSHPRECNALRRPKHTTPSDVQNSALYQHRFFFFPFISVPITMHRADKRARANKSATLTCRSPSLSFVLFVKYFIWPKLKAITLQCLGVRYGSFVPHSSHLVRTHTAEAEEERARERERERGIPHFPCTLLQRWEKKVLAWLKQAYVKLPPGYCRDCS